MNKIKKAFITLLVISLPLVLSSCSEYKEPAPFFDGLFLEYEVNNREGESYQVSALENAKFKLNKKVTAGGLFWRLIR